MYMVSASADFLTRSYINYFIVFYVYIAADRAGGPGGAAAVPRGALSEYII